MAQADDPEAPDREPILAVLSARALLAALRGEEAPALPESFTAEPPQTLQERAEGGDAQAQQRRLALGHLQRLPGRAAAAVARDRAPVVLMDGSSLSLDDAERLLAKKEERSAHVMLRRSIDAARATIRQLPFDGSEDRPPRLPGVFHDEARAFLLTTRGLRDASRDVLASAGGEPLDTAPALARGLDLPDESGAFGEANTLALLGAAREAARPRHRVGRVLVPRALAGLTLALDREDVRFAQPPNLLRCDRQLATLVAGAGALLGAFDPTSPSASSMPVALALGLADVASRRAVGLGRADAERSARVGVATAVLLTRARLVLATLEDVQGARDALIEAWGVDPGAAVVEDWLLPPWLMLDAADAARPWLHAAHRALALRDGFDETFALRRETWEALPELAPALQSSTAPAESSAPGETAPAPPWAQAWIDWAGALF